MATAYICVMRQAYHLPFGVTEMCLHLEEADLTSRGNPRCWARSQERLDLLRAQELLAGLGIQPQRKKSTDMELLWSFTDRLKGP
jgi:hypothetical protein